VSTVVNKIPCSKRRYGCVGYVVAEECKHRDSSGALSIRLVMVCNKCGQAHGRAVSA
jgi:hypothetical protein